MNLEAYDDYPRGIKSFSLSIFALGTKDDAEKAQKLLEQVRKAYPRPDEGRIRLGANLMDKSNIIVNASSADDRKIWLRTAQIFRGVEDYEKLGSAVLALRSVTVTMDTPTGLAVTPDGQSVYVGQDIS
jgi:hypothetical protein